MKFDIWKQRGIRNYFKKRIKNKIEKKKNLKTSVKGKSIRLHHNEEKLRVNHFIKLMSSEIKFVIENWAAFMNLNLSSKISIEIFTVSETIQVYIKVVKNVTLNRMYNRKKWKVLANLLCYLRIHDKKHDHSKSSLFQYFLINNLEMSVKEKHIWFKINMQNKKQRNKAILKISRQHAVLKKNNKKNEFVIVNSTDCSERNENIMSFKKHEGTKKLFFQRVIFWKNYWNWWISKDSKINIHSIFTSSWWSDKIMMTSCYFYSTASDVLTLLFLFAFCLFILFYFNHLPFRRRKGLFCLKRLLGIQRSEKKEKLKTTFSEQKRKAQ